jgi:hypothetical protein
MRIIGKKTILKLKKKNIGNSKLCDAIDQLICDLESFDPKKNALKDVREDADSVHQDGFYFFDIHTHRTLILIELDDEGEATVIWAGNHQEYERTYKITNPRLKNGLEPKTTLNNGITNRHREINPTRFNHK